MTTARPPVMVRIRFVRGRDLAGICGEMDRKEGYAERDRKNRDNIDEKLTKKNLALVGRKNGAADTREILKTLSWARQPKDGLKPSDPMSMGAIGVNFLFCAKEYLKNKTENEIIKWAEDSVGWIKNDYKEFIITSAVLHVDEPESGPHLHVLAVPISCGRNGVGKRVNYGKYFTDSRDILKKAALNGSKDLDTKCGRMQTNYFLYMNNSNHLVSRGETASPSEENEKLSRWINPKIRRELLKKEEEKLRKEKILLEEEERKIKEFIEIKNKELENINNEISKKRMQINYELEYIMNNNKKLEEQKKRYNWFSYAKKELKKDIAQLLKKADESIILRTKNDIGVVLNELKSDDTYDDNNKYDEENTSSYKMRF